MKYTKIPALSGIDLIKLLKKDNWIEQRHGRHGVALIKSFGVEQGSPLFPTPQNLFLAEPFQKFWGPNKLKLEKEDCLIYLININNAKTLRRTSKKKEELLNRIETEIKRRFRIEKYLTSRVLSLLKEIIKMKEQEEDFLKVS